MDESTAADEGWKELVTATALLFGLTGGFLIGAVVGLTNLLLIVLQSVRVVFYRAYFRRKQEDAGYDPDEVLRREFPVLWRFIR